MIFIYVRQCPPRGMGSELKSGYENWRGNHREMPVTKIEVHRVWKYNGLVARMHSNARKGSCKKKLFSREQDCKGLEVRMFSAWRKNVFTLEASDDAALDPLFQAPSRRENVGNRLDLTLAHPRSASTDQEELTYVPERPSWISRNQHVDSENLSQSENLPMSHPNPLSNSADVCFSEPNPNVGIESLHGTNYPSSAPVLPRPSGKRKAHAKKSVSAKKVCKKPDRVESLDTDDEEDFYESSRDRWTDEHVHELITLRAEMDVEFENQAGKQGVNNWQRLHRRLSVAVRGFTKSWESCKKKWQAEYKKYRTDKRHLNISGNSRHITCKYFDVIDDAWKNRANVKKVIHCDAHLSENPAPMESPADTINTTVSPLQGAALGTPPTSGVVSVSPTLITRQDRKDAKRSTADRLCGLISDIAMHSASLAQTSESFLKSFDSHMANLIAKL